MRWAVSAALAALLLSVGATAFAAEPPAEVLPLSSVRAGMKGWGLTVMKGSTPERFDVEVLGVLPNTLGRARILVKVSGLGLEKTGVLAGMSGSPVYLDGKLAGAVSATWAFGKEPIGQVTPIEAMLDAEAASAPAGARTTVATAPAWDAFAAAVTLPPDARAPALEELAARFRPGRAPEAATLLAPVAAGIPASALLGHADDLARLGLSFPVAAGAWSAAAATPPASGEPSPGLVPGGALTAFLLDGDLQLGATGTVTAVLPGGRFVAFGHPFLGMGSLELPVSASRIVDVFPSAMMSFKLAAPYPAAFRMTADRDPAIAGRTDRVAALVPVRFRFEAPGAPPRELRWGTANAANIFPLLLAMSTDVALLLNDPTPAQKTVAFRLTVDTKAGPFVYEDVATGPRARDIAVFTTTALAGLVTENEFEDPQISGVEISLKTAPGETRVKLVDAGLSARKVAPGQKLSATVRLAGRRGDEITRVLTVTVPKEAPEGRATLLVSDGGTATALRLSLDPAPPRSLAGLRRSVERLLPSTRLVASLVGTGRGAATGPATVSALPPTAAALLAEGADGDPARAAISSRLLAEDVTNLDRPVAGSVRLEVEIERPRP